MSTINALYHIMKADFLERVRRYSFIITIAIICYIAYKYIPSKEHGYITLSLSGYRGIYNSAWIGASFSLVTTMALTLAGFYIIKNSIERDEKTKVGQIIASTQIKNSTYIFGKFLSNLLVMSFMVLIIIVLAIIMQLVRAEDTAINLHQLVAPFLFSTMPVIIMISAVAIFFETVPFLRKGFGNVVFFICWMTVITLVTISVFSKDVDNTNPQIKNEVLGISPIIVDMVETAQVQCDDYRGGFQLGYRQVTNLQTFVWNPSNLYTKKLIFKRMIWAFPTVLLILLTTLFFNRFDYSTKKILKGQIKFKTKNKNQEYESKSLYSNETILLTPINSYSNSFIINFIRIVKGEFKLLVKGLPKLWYLVFLSLIVAQFTTPINTVREYVLPLAFIWPIILWSKIGVNEKYYQTHQLIFSCLGSNTLQPIASWMAGVLFTFLAGSGAAIRFIAGGLWIELGIFIIAALFITSMAFALGVMSTSRKLFQVVYMLIWYIGPLNKAYIFDYIGVNDESVLNGQYLYYLIAAILLLLIGLVIRRWQVVHN